MAQCTSYWCMPNPKPAQWICSRCKAAEPPTVYCSRECHKKMWMFHKKYCGKTAYRFRFTIVGSKNPVIFRDVAVPAWFTFQQLHFTLQYAFGPWNCTHQHEFRFAPAEGRNLNPLDLFGRSDDRLKIGRPHPDDEDFGPSLDERNISLSDIYDVNGSFRSVVLRDGQVLPLFYDYDFGDSWLHRIEFLGETHARADRPLFSKAEGCGPLEDCGGITGWEEIKAAFSAKKPTRTQKEKLNWAQRVSYLGAEFDPMKIHPTIEVMNYEGRWENHVKEYAKGDEGFDGGDGDGYSE